MAAVSKNYYDVRLWLEKVAKSCKTLNQYNSCIRLIWNFKRTYDSTKDGEVVFSDVKYLRLLALNTLSKISDEYEQKRSEGVFDDSAGRILPESKIKLKK